MRKLWTYYFIAVIAALIFSLWTVATHAAPVPQSDEGNITLPWSDATTTTKEKQPLKKWSISSVTTHTEHYACEAVRKFDDGVTLTVRLPRVEYNRTTMLGITVDGVAYGMQKPAYGLWQIDNGDVTEIMGSPRGEYATDMQIPADVTNADTLKKLAQGRKLRLVFENKFFEFSLEESAAMLSALRRCNDTGQQMLNKRRIDAAQKATTRSS